MRTLSQDQTVLFVTKIFHLIGLKNPSDCCLKCEQLYIKHKGSQNDNNNVEDCIKVLNGWRKKIPPFQSHVFDQLPFYWFW